MRFLLFAALLLSACSGPERGSSRNRKYQNHPCSQIAIQDDSWSPTNTQAVVSCLLAKAPGASQKVQTLEAKNFKNLGLFLNQAFRNPDKRKKLKNLLKALRKESSFLTNTLKDPVLRRFSRNTQIDPALPWIVETLKEGLRDSESPQLLIDWLRAFNDLNPTPRKIHSLLADVEILLNGINKPSLNTHELLNISMSILADLSESPRAFDSLLKLSDVQACKSPTESQQVLTENLFLQTIQFFLQDKDRPSHFLNSIQQGFSFWNAVCQSETGSTQEEVYFSMEWILRNWSMLQDFFANKESLSLIEAGTQLLHDSASFHSSNSGAALNVFFAKSFVKKMIAQVSRTPESLQKWIEVFPTFKNIFAESVHSGQTLRFSNELLDSTLQSLQTGELAYEILDVPPLALQEIWGLIRELDDEEFSGLIYAFESGEAAELLEFMDWILTFQGQRMDEGRYTPDERSHSPAPEMGLYPLPSVPQESDLARALNALHACFARYTVRDDVDTCLKQEGFLHGPPLVRAFWKLPNSSRVLAKAHAPQIEYFALPSTAKKIWQPALRWIKESQFPIAATLDFIVKSEKRFQELPEHDWNLLLQKPFLAFQEEASKSSSSPALREFRRSRIDDISTKLFADPTLRDFILDPRFLERILNWFNSPTSQNAKRSLVKLISTQLTIDLWVRDSRLAPMEVNVIDAFDVLFWELQLPLVSSDFMIRGILESFEKMRNTNDLRSWMRSKISQLEIARLLSLSVDAPGEGLHRRFDNAIRILETILAKTEIHSALLVASKALTLFHGPQGYFTNDSAKVLLALRQIGVLTLVSTAMSDTAPWIDEVLNPNTQFQIPSHVIRSLAVLMRNLLDRTPAETLRRMVVVQLQQDLWLVRGATAAGLSALYSDPKVNDIFVEEYRLILSTLSNAYTQVLAPWLQTGAQHSDMFWFRQTLLLKSLILNLDQAPHTSWLALIAAMANEPVMKKFVTEIHNLHEQDMNQLIQWLESGIPLRLVRWNRLMHQAE